MEELIVQIVGNPLNNFTLDQLCEEARRYKKAGMTSPDSALARLIILKRLGKRRDQTVCLKW